MNKTQIIYSLSFIFISVPFYWFILPRNYRSLFLLAASIYFMSLFSIKFVVFFVINVLLVYIAGTFMSKGEKQGKLILKLVLFGLIGSLCVFKYSHIVLDSIFHIGSKLKDVEMHSSSLSQIAMPLGTSYIIFRLIHYIVETYRKTFPKHTFWDVALYVFFFPTFIAGPVDRFQRFLPQTEAKKSFDPSDINYGLFRIISGIIRKFIIADNLLPVIMPVLTSAQESNWIVVVLSIYGLAIWVYMDFAGYTDMAIGVSRLFGYKIMENFNNPFLKKNIALLWRNWHISVYSYIRDYFFYPFFGYHASQLKIYIGIFLTMIIFMLWHEGSLPFLILGIYYGSGLVIWQLFQEIKGKYRQIRKFIDNRYFDPVSIFLTFSYWSFGLIFFFFDINNVENILQKIF